MRHGRRIKKASKLAVDRSNFCFLTRAFRRHDVCQVLCMLIVPNTCLRSIYFLLAEPFAEHLHYFYLVIHSPRGPLSEGGERGGSGERRSGAGGQEGTTDRGGEKGGGRGIAFSVSPLFSSLALSFFFFSFLSGTSGKAMWPRRVLFRARVSSFRKVRVSV